MKRMIIGLTLLCSVSVFAQDNWETESLKHYLATTKDEIKQVLGLYPEITTPWDISASDVKNIDLTDTTYKYVGVHTCQENDPRLRENFVMWEICLKNGTCIAPLSAPRLFPIDPCGDHL